MRREKKEKKYNNYGPPLPAKKIYQRNTLHLLVIFMSKCPPGGRTKFYIYLDHLPIIFRNP